MISYEQIEKANSEIKKTDIKGKEYAGVSERVIAFRKVYPNGRIETERIENDEESVTMIAKVFNDEDKLIATGHASEVKKGLVNSVSMLENCETSAIGRALGFCGFGVDNGIASEQEIEKVEEHKLDNKKIEIYKDMYISEKDAMVIVKTAIADLMRRLGIVKEQLSCKVREQLWTTLEELNYSQLGCLEAKLKSVNNTNSEWHDLYNQNTKIKDVVPVNQEIIYKSSIYKLGQYALKQSGDDEIKKNAIIDAYMDMGVDITKEIK